MEELHNSSLAVGIFINLLVQTWIVRDLLVVHRSLVCIVLVTLLSLNSVLVTIVCADTAILGCVDRALSWNQEANEMKSSHVSTFATHFLQRS